MRLYEFESKVKPEVYIDMDGVLVDFFNAWANLMGEKSFRDIKDVDKGLQAIRDEDDFWLKLKPTPNAGKLLALVRELKGSYTILSSPLADDPRSEPHKRMWVEKNLKQFPPKKVIITGNKAKYAQQSDGTPNILIDDFGQNIDKWNAAGGIGVKHKDHKFERTFKNLMNHLKKDEKTTEDDLEEISAKDIGAGALAGLMALTPVSKAFGQDANTNPLPNKQTSTMVQKDVGGKQDLSKISVDQVKSQIEIKLADGNTVPVSMDDIQDAGGLDNFIKDSKSKIAKIYAGNGQDVPDWSMYFKGKSVHDVKYPDKYEYRQGTVKKNAEQNREAKAQWEKAGKPLDKKILNAYIKAATKMKGKYALLKSSLRGWGQTLNAGEKSPYRGEIPDYKNYEYVNQALDAIGHPR